VVFTIPEILKPLFYINQRTCYTLLFRASAEAIRKTVLNPAFLGAQTGNVSVLHTWGQTLTYHPHIHVIVPAGGLDSDNMQWIKAPKKFFVPVKALSRIFRASLCKGFEQAYMNKELIIPDHRKGLYLDFKSLKDKLYEKNWHVYVKKSMRGAAQVINYLGRYTHRVAISNSRILSAGHGKVCFRWKDYRDNHFKVIELPAAEFIRRFLQHVLPCGFYKIRYFGIFASANAKTKMTQCFALLNTSPGISALEGLPVYEVLCLLTGKDLLCCPACKKGRMIPYEPGYISGKASG